MDYQARLTDILTMLDQGEYLDDGGVESAQQEIVKLNLEELDRLKQNDPLYLRAVQHGRKLQEEEMIAYYMRNNDLTLYMAEADPTTLQDKKESD